MATENQKQIIDGITDEILLSLRAAANEQHFPGPDPDRMDDEIRIQKSNAQKLRRLREELEDLFSSVIP